MLGRMLFLLQELFAGKILLNEVKQMSDSGFNRDQIRFYGAAQGWNYFILGLQKA